MILTEEKYELNGKEILLRSANPEDAGMLIDYLKTVTRETGFLMTYPDEVKYTIDEEVKFINRYNEAENCLLMLAFVDGDYAGNCSFEVRTGSRRVKHRAEIGIALFQKYAGFGLGRLMLEVLLKKMKEQGLEQAELAVADGNDRAYRLYESLGFRKCGRIPGAYKYDDGTCSDEIIMVKSL